MDTKGQAEGQDGAPSAWAQGEAQRLLDEAGYGYPTQEPRTYVRAIVARALDAARAEGQKAIRATQQVGPYPADGDVCGRCGHRAFDHANFGRGECQASCGCGAGCHEFVRPVQAEAQRSQEGATTHLAGTLDDYRNAPSEEGPLAYTWQDKPHRLVYDLVEEIERLRVALAAKEAELARVIAVAGEAVGTDPALRSSGCVDALATWAGTLQRDLSDVRAQLAAQQETIRDLSSLMWRAVNWMRGRIEPVDAGGWCPNCHCLGIHTEWCPLAVKEQCEAAVMAALKEQG